MSLICHENALPVFGGFFSMYLTTATMLRFVSNKKRLINFLQSRNRFSQNFRYLGLWHEITDLMQRRDSLTNDSDQFNLYAYD